MKKDSSSNRLEPSIRFPQFTYSWEQKKFNDLFKERRDKTVAEDEDVLLSCAITGIYLNSELFGHQRGRSNIGYLKIKMNDLILSAQNLHLGNANVNKRFEHGIISPAYKVYEIVDCNPDFIQAWVKQESTKKFFLDVTTEGASQCRKNIDWNLLANSTITVPSEIEQKVIGDFVSTIENTITLHQQKIEVLKKYKRGLLQAMFPANGETVPKVRFPGFTGAWEKRKLGELAIFNPKADLPNEFEYVDLESVVGTEMLSHRRESKRTAPSRAQRLAQKGDLFYQTVRPYQKNNYLFEKPDKNYVFSTGYARMRPLIDGRFLLSLVQNDGFVKTVLDNCTGTSYPAINSNDLAQVEVYSPNDTQEQKRIGDFFKDIDDLIILHQRKLETLSRYKKGLLQQMFI